MPATNARAPTAKKLSHLWRLIFRLPGLVEDDQIVIDERAVAKPSVLSRALAEAEVVPFWLEECPVDHKPTWGDRWDKVRAGMQTLASLSAKGDIDKFDWVEADMSDVLNLARAKKWDGAVDRLVSDGGDFSGSIQKYSTLHQQILNHLDAENLSIQALYREPSRYERVYKPGSKEPKGFVSAQSWDTILSEELPKMLGDGIRGDGPMVGEPATTWWHATIQSLLDVHAKYRIRADKNLANVQKAVENVFGSGFLKPEIPVGFTLTKARSTLKTLRSFKSYLEWQLISPQDVKIMDQALDLSAPDVTTRIQARWQSLTPNAQKMEYCLMAIGWMVGVVEAKTKTTVELDFGGDRDGQIGTSLFLFRPLFKSDGGQSSTGGSWDWRFRINNFQTDSLHRRRMKWNHSTWKWRISPTNGWGAWILIPSAPP